jgi:hypothetical protein
VRSSDQLNLRPPSRSERCWSDRPQQIDLQGCPFARAAVDPNLPARLAHDDEHHGNPQPRSSADLLRREKGLEGALGDLGLIPVPVSRIASRALTARLASAERRRECYRLMYLCACRSGRLSGTSAPVEAGREGLARPSQNGSAGLGPAGSRRGCRAAGAQTGFR